MGSEIIHDHADAGRQGPAQKLLDIGTEDFAVHRAVNDERSRQAGRAQGGNEGRGLPVPVWNGREETLATRAASEAARHIGRRPGLVDEDEMSRVQLRLVRAPDVSRGRYVRPALLGGVE